MHRNLQPEETGVWDLDKLDPTEVACPALSSAPHTDYMGTASHDNNIYLSAIAGTSVLMTLCLALCVLTCCVSTWQRCSPSWPVLSFPSGCLYHWTPCHPGPGAPSGSSSASRPPPESVWTCGELKKPLKGKFNFFAQSWPFFFHGSRHPSHLALYHVAHRGTAPSVLTSRR